jgi:hypothetical protein
MNSNLSEDARRFRKATGTAGLEQTLCKALGVLDARGIAHLVTGGYAVQEHGSLRHTDNIDLIVPDVTSAREALCAAGFEAHPVSRTVVVDPDYGYEVRLHC